MTSSRVQFIFLQLPGNSPGSVKRSKSKIDCTDPVLQFKSMVAPGVPALEQVLRKVLRLQGLAPQQEAQLKLEHPNPGQVPLASLQPA